MRMFRNESLRRTAKDQACVNCGAQDGTVVAAHSNSGEHGKGARLKAHDCYIAFLCFKCHFWLDQGSGDDPTGVWGPARSDKREMFRRCMDRTLLVMWQNGLIKVAA